MEKKIMPKRNYKVSLKDIEEVEALLPFNRRYFRTLFKPDSEIKASVFVERFEPGSESYSHYHVPPQVEIFYGLKGTGICELVSDDRSFFEKYTIEPGDCVYCPERWAHKIKNASEEDEWVVLGIVFNTETEKE